jgi:hypothetical protein
MVLLAACDPVSDQNMTTLDDLPPPDLSGSSSTSTTTTQAPPVTNDPSPYTYRGYLPNGTDFRVVAPGSREETMTLVLGVFSFQSEGGPIPVGEIRYARVGDPVGNAYDSGILELSAGEWLVDILFNDDVLDALGGEALAEPVVTRGIELEEIEGWPVIRLASPFTWGFVGAVPPAVRFESFAIEPGCTEIAVACTDNRAVQVVALADIGPGSPGMSQERRDNTFVETSAARSAFDPNYLNPGPLDPRLSADLVWTGEEMIVWGGKQARDGLTTLVDGAAFNPETDEWRMIASFPLQGPQATRAVWADAEMIVVSPDGTFGYDPESDSWRTIGNGVVPSEWHDRMLYSEGKVYVWARSSLIHELSLETGEWRLIDGPEMPMEASPYSGVLRWPNVFLVAVTLDGSGCTGKNYWKWMGQTWAPLPDATLATEEFSDCSMANQTASVSNDLVVWDDDTHPAAIYSTYRDEWRELPPIPLGGTEGASGPVPMGTDHFLVPRWGEAAIFDATTEQWTRVILPGQGTDAEMIWTGEEILAWGIWETFDAWRWTPGQTIGGGDDAT